MSEKHLLQIVGVTFYVAALIRAFIYLHKWPGTLMDAELTLFLVGGLCSVGSVLLLGALVVASHEDEVTE